MAYAWPSQVCRAPSRSPFRCISTPRHIRAAPAHPTATCRPPARRSVAGWMPRILGPLHVFLGPVLCVEHDPAVGCGARRRVWALFAAFRPMCAWLVYTSTAGPAVQPVHYMYGWTYALPHAHHGHVGAHCGRGIRWFDVRLHFRWARARFPGIMVLSWAARAVGRMGTVMGKSCPGSHKADHRPL